jgi:hypothetical protein
MQACVTQGPWRCDTDERAAMRKSRFTIPDVPGDIHELSLFYSYLPCFGRGPPRVWVASPCGCPLSATRCATRRRNHGFSKPTAVLTGQQATITWKSANATSCTASNAWTGTRPTSGSVNVMLQQPTAQTYTLLCEGSGASATQSVTLAYDPTAVACAVKPAIATRLGRRSVHRQKLPGSHS